MDNAIFRDTDDYISSLLGFEDDALLSVEQTMREAGLPFASVSPNQGKFLQVMALACNAKKILELGTLGGYSTIWLARALPEDGRLVTIELQAAHADVAEKNIGRAGLSDKVEIRVGKAIDVLQQLKDERAGPFDLIFIDADKPPYTEYFLAAVELSRPGTFIIADNVIREGKVLDESHEDAAVKGVQRFNKMLAANENASSTIIQTVGIKYHDGMSLSVVTRGS